jgi:hypothetical protein
MRSSLLQASNFMRKTELQLVQEMGSRMSQSS